MRAWKIETVLGTAIAVILVFSTWQQGRILKELETLNRGNGAAAAPARPAGGPPAAAQAPPSKPSPLQTVSFDVGIEGAPFRGAAGAQAVLLEFSDFQCPFCARYIRDTYPRIVTDYVDTGKVRYVFRHMPIQSLHPNAMNAALAANCSAAQGKFWEMHDRLFANQNALGLPQLLGYGAGLGLDETKYRACVNSRSSMSSIQLDHDDGVKGGLTGTPGFFFGSVGADGRLRAVRRIIGAQPYALFQTAIEDVLAGRSK